MGWNALTVDIEPGRAGCEWNPTMTNELEPSGIDQPAEDELGPEVADPGSTTPSLLWRTVGFVAGVNTAGAVLAGLGLAILGFFTVAFMQLGDVTEQASSVPFFLGLLGGIIVIGMAMFVHLSLVVRKDASMRRRLIAAAMIVSGNIASLLYGLYLKSIGGVVIAVLSTALVVVGWKRRYGVPIKRDLVTAGIVAALLSPLCAIAVTPVTSYAVMLFAASDEAADSDGDTGDTITAMYAESVHRAARAYAAYDSLSVPTTENIAAAAVDAGMQYDPETGKLTLEDGATTWFVCPQGPQSSACPTT